MTIRVIQRRRDDYFYLGFPGSTQEAFVGERIVLTPWQLAGVTLAELRSAAIRLRRRYEHQLGSPGWASPDDGAVFDIYDATPAEYRDLDDDVPLFLDAEIVADRAGVRVQVTTLVDSAVTEERISALAATAADRMQADVRAILRGPENASGVIWTAEAALRRRDAQVSRLLALGHTISVTVVELAGGADPDAVANILEAGYPSGLLGAKEGDWLEAKSQPWDLDAEFGKIELAQDVARFANAAGGVIVIGARTHKKDGEETIIRVDGIRPDLFSAHRARMVIDRRVYPPIVGLTVRRVTVRGSHSSLAYIRIPPQDPALQPFLVHGAIAGRKVEGEFISIVKRRGDQSLSIRAEELHTWLTAGRRLLREGRIGRSR